MKYKVRLASQKRYTYDILDEKELICGSIKPHLVSGYLVQLMGELRRFNNLKSAINYVTNQQV